MESASRLSGWGGRAHSTVRTLALLAAFTTLAACSGSRGGPAASGGGDEHKLVGAQAPPFELPTQSGSPAKISLEGLSGKVVLVDFWATWCKPCKESFPHYQRLSEKYSGDLVVVGISEDDDASGIADFAKTTGAKFALAWDDGQALSQSYEPPTMPTSYLVDRAGIVRYVHVGFHKGDEAELDSKIAQLAK
jgi:thiol-disulfide isomerase/thioredoxin